jgi:hypothetical protein
MTESTQSKNVRAHWQSIAVISLFFLAILLMISNIITTKNLTNVLLQQSKSDTQIADTLKRAIQKVELNLGGYIPKETRTSILTKEQLLRYSIAKEVEIEVYGTVSAYLIADQITHSNLRIEMKLRSAGSISICHHGEIKCSVVATDATNSKNELVDLKIQEDFLVSEYPNYLLNQNDPRILATNPVQIWFE